MACEQVLYCCTKRKWKGRVIRNGVIKKQHAEEHCCRQNSRKGCKNLLISRW